MIGLAIRAVALLGIAWAVLQQMGISLSTEVWQFICGVLGLVVLTGGLLAR